MFSLNILLVNSSIFLCNLSLVFGEGGFFSFLEFTVVTQVPSDKVDVGTEGILNLNCCFQLWFFLNRHVDIVGANKVLLSPFQYVCAVHKLKQISKTCFENLNDFFSDSQTDILQVKNCAVQNIKNFVSGNLKAFVAGEALKNLLDFLLNSFV